MLNRFSYRLTQIVLVVQLFLILVSWLLSAMAVPGVRSMLSADGLRWYLGHFVEMIQTPFLSWILLGAMAYGSVRQSGVLHLTLPLSGRMRWALGLSLSLLIIYIGVVLMLIAVPHAVLLSATGRLWPSPFSAALIPILCVAMVLVSAVYGFATSSLGHAADLFSAFISGLSLAAPFLFLYVLFAQFFALVYYVFPVLG